MPHRLSLDRFEGNDKQIAVLVTENGDQIDFPRELLPGDARPGDVLTLAIERDRTATATLAAQTRAVEEELKASDPGGDLKL